jgi:hypothetical protein
MRPQLHGLCLHPIQSALAETFTSVAQIGGTESTSRAANRNDSLAVHEFQDAVDRIFERRVLLAVRGNVAGRLIVGGRVAQPLNC